MASGVDALKALVTAAGIAAKDKQGNGWLHYAAMSANADAATWLLAAGADKTAKNISGETAYDVALKRGKRTWPPCSSQGIDTSAFGRIGLRARIEIGV